MTFEAPDPATQRYDLQAALDIILKNAVQALGGSAGVVATWDEVERRFAASASYGLDEKALEHLGPFLGEAIPDLAGSSESFDLLSRLGAELSLPSSEAGMAQDPVIALPLRIGGHSIGLIYILRPSNAASFTSGDQPVLSAFAEQAAIAVQNARLASLMAQEKQRLESILEGSAEGIMAVDSQRRITGFNSAMERLLGYPREDVLGKQCSRVLGFRDWRDNDLCGERCPMRSVPARPRPVFQQQGRITTKDGQTVDVEMVYSIVRAPDGKPLNAVINVRDITRLREVENLRSTFLSMLGHQLQTPISIMKGYTSTLARGDGKWDEAVMRQGLQVIEDEADRLSRIVNRLLLASRIESGTLTLRTEPVQLKSLVGKVVRRFEGLAPTHELVVETDKGLPPVQADADLMEEVLGNLIDNAIKYSPDGGEITISAEMGEGEVAITVADEGIGIPRRDLESVFERFHRVDSDAVQAVRGIGLGLFICRYIVEAHGGAISVESELGQGSQFTVTLPLGSAGHEQ